MSVRVPAVVLAAAVLLAGCGGAGAPTVPPAATATTVPAGQVPTESAPSGGTTGEVATPPAGDFPPASEGLTEEVPPGADSPAIEPGPGTPIPGEVIPPGSDTPAIEPGPGTVVAGAGVADTAPATQLAPELEQAIRAHLQGNAALQDAPVSDVAIEDVYIRVRLTAAEPQWMILRADATGYAVVWGPGATLSAAEAQQLGIPAALIP